MKAENRVLLTFDVEGPPLREDFLNDEIVVSLFKVLRLLEKYDLKGFFFFTGTVAEQICRYPKILELLSTHEIGYHASSHSIKPAIFEYTDVEDYAKAVEISRKRETSSIDPLSGKVKNDGGILLLRQIFHKKEIKSFRAPFLCWSPPHLEAMRELEIKFDFSTDLNNAPIWHKDITFFPYPIIIDSVGVNFPIIMKKMLSQKFCVLLVHPSHLVFKAEESFYYHYRNPFRPVRIRKRAPQYVTLKFLELEVFLLGLRLLRKRGLINLSTDIENTKKKPDPNKIDVAKVYNRSVYAVRNLFGYQPKFLLSHFRHFIKE